MPRKRTHRVRQSLLRFKIDDKPVTLMDEVDASVRTQRLLVDGEVIGTVETERGSKVVTYSMTKWDRPKTRFVGAGGRSKEALLRDCRRLIIREANGISANGNGGK